MLVLAQVQSTAIGYRLCKLPPRVGGAPRSPQKLQLKVAFLQP